MRNSRRAWTKKWCHVDGTNQIADKSACSEGSTVLNDLHSSSPGGRKTPRNAGELCRRRSWANYRTRLDLTKGLSVQIAECKTQIPEFASIFNAIDILVNAQAAMGFVLQRHRSLE